MRPQWQTAAEMLKWDAEYRQTNAATESQNLQSHVERMPSAPKTMHTSALMASLASHSGGGGVGAGGSWGRVPVVKVDKVGVGWGDVGNKILDKTGVAEVQRTKKRDSVVRSDMSFDEEEEALRGTVVSEYDEEEGMESPQGGGSSPGGGGEGAGGERGDGGGEGGRGRGG